MAKTKSGTKSSGGRSGGPVAGGSGGSSGGGQSGGRASGGTFSASNPAQFFRQVRQETSKVTWPSRKETWIASLMVFIMVALTAVFFFFVDQILAYVVRLILGLGG